MAISWVSGSNTTYGSRTNTTITAPASIADGDYLIASLFTFGGGGAPTASPPAGFTSITSTTAFSGLFRQQVWIKKAASESGSYTFTHTSGSSQGWIGVYRGVDTTTPQDATATANSGNGTTSTWTGLTTVTAGAWLVAVGSDNADTTNNLSPPSGMTERLDLVLCYAADENIAAAGATGNRTHTNNSSSAGGGQPWMALLIALRPAGGTAYTLTAAAGSYAVTGTAATLKHGYRLTAAAGSYAVTGTNATLRRALPLTAGAGSYAVTGTAAGLLVGRRVVAAAGSYALTGAAATLKHGSSLTAAAGSYALTGTAATLRRALPLTAGSGSYSVTGTAATLTYTPISDSTYTLSALSGSYALTGTSAGFLSTRLLAADAGSYVLTGSDATLAPNAPVEPPLRIFGAGGGGGYGDSYGRKRKKKKEEPEDATVVAVVEPDGERTEFVVRATDLREELPTIADIMNEARRAMEPVMTLRPNDDDEVLLILHLLAEMED